MDIVNRVERHPLPGETIKGLKTEFNPGGKGANQAVAAARSGGAITMICALGNDSFGTELLETLKRDEINTEYIQQKESTSGLAFITVDASGENSIILESGANGLLDTDDIKTVLPEVAKQADLILLQNEIPWETTKYAIEEANKREVPVYLNPAPALQVPSEILSLLTGIFLNETEAEIITGIHVTNQSSVKQAASILIDNGISEVIITMGKQGSYFENHLGNSLFTPGHKVDVVDTTAAGDTFIGAYLVGKSSDNSPQTSLQFATAASALTVTKDGAQKSIPYRKEIIDFLETEA
jgi:ribokinase